MQFDCEEFLKNPDKDQFLSAKKSELLKLAKLCNIEVKSKLTKQEVRNILVQYLIDENFFSEDMQELIVEVPKSTDDSELRQFELEMRKLEMEENTRKMQLEMELEVKRLEIEEREKEKAREHELKKM